MADKKKPIISKDFNISNFYPLFFTIAFIIVMIQYSFSSLEAIFYDLRVKWDLGVGAPEAIVIVTMDEESDDFLGETYPYTYATHSRFLKKLIEAQPKIVSYFISLEEPETEIEEKYLTNVKNQIESFKKVGGNFRFASTVDNWGIQLPPEPLRGLGMSLSLVVFDEDHFARDDVTRRAIVNYAGENTIHLYLANKIRELRGENQLEANAFLGSYYVREYDATYTLFRYTSSGIPEKDKNIKFIPYHKVAVGSFDKELFKNKLVLIGPQYISSADDFTLTPFAKENLKTPVMSIHSQIIQSLIKDKTIYKVPRVVSNIISLLIAIFLSFVISRVQPARGLLITVGTMLGVIITSFLLFSALGIWIYLSHIILTIFVVYYIWVPFRAIAEYQTRYAIEEEAKLLKQVDNLKQNFISLMSHDLKTPVAKVAGIADILYTQFKNNGEQQKLLNAIKDSTHELNKFISSILDLTKVESRNLTLKVTSKDINQIIESLVTKLKFQATKADMEIETELSPLYPIEIDVDLIARVISNLIENAIKYAGTGKLVKIKTWDDDKWVYVEISDNGLGINPGDLGHIFDKFYRVKDDASHSIKGSGLGLFLVKYFVELHQGTIEVNSIYNEGTTFLIKLPNE
ncbi:MAG: CHASE2 domain-containing protein [Bacteriovoracaceae bacterium]|jgi:signal transduction histidine kinase|nr:CHASE2 domain-containing protein [Bacteriovoracaceae bacterium]